MPLKLNVGLARKVGQPNYGSLSASCHLELELDARLLVIDRDHFQDQLREAFVECSQAVHDELFRQQGNYVDAVACEPGAPVRRRDAQAPADHHNGNGQRATSRQIGFAQQLAAEIQGLGVRRLDGFATKMFSEAAGRSLELRGVPTHRCPQRVEGWRARPGYGSRQWERITATHCCRREAHGVPRRLALHRRQAPATWATEPAGIQAALFRRKRLSPLIDRVVRRKPANRSKQSLGRYLPPCPQVRCGA